MGTFWHITIAEELDDAAKANLEKSINNTLEAVNDSMSTYRNESELMRFNRSTSVEPQAISGGLRRVIAKALSVSEESDGIYDVTVGPLVNLWGFGPIKREDKPTDEEITKALQHIGYHKLRLNERGLAKEDPNIFIDLSSIAKGYGVDVVAETIIAAGYHDFLVEIGGEVRAEGKKYDMPWRVGIERPEVGLTAGDTVENVVVMSEALPAMATSGNYRNYAEKNGEMAYHIIDPRDGKSHSSRLLSATVLAKDCMTADAYATALMVLGEEKALDFANKQGLAAELILAGGNSNPFIIERSQAFIAAIQEEK
ncbi:MAG: FAD:protein FMN transferase [Cardiobacteriaceae bacterium]|nr:FAD:protein FMN transferase [Cardiobacteriaceae bacterium]